jgi:hypothetical protein
MHDGMTTEQYIAVLEYQVAKFNSMLAQISLTNPEVFETPEMESLVESERLMWN